jgi:hypothetical protein
MLRLQIVDTGFCAETRITPGVQSGRPSVNRTAVILSTGYRDHYFRHVGNHVPRDRADIFRPVSKRPI